MSRRPLPRPDPLAPPTGPLSSRPPVSPFSETVRILNRRVKPREVKRGRIILNLKVIDKAGGGGGPANRRAGIPSRNRIIGKRCGDVPYRPFQPPMKMTGFPMYGKPYGLQGIGPLAFQTNAGMASNTEARARAASGPASAGPAPAVPQYQSPPSPSSSSGSDSRPSTPHQSQLAAPQPPSQPQPSALASAPPKLSPQQAAPQTPSAPSQLEPSVAQSAATVPPESPAAFLPCSPSLSSSRSSSSSSLEDEEEGEDGGGLSAAPSHRGARRRALRQSRGGPRLSQPPAASMDSAVSLSASEDAAAAATPSSAAGGPPGERRAPVEGDPDWRPEMAPRCANVVVTDVTTNLLTVTIKEFCQPAEAGSGPSSPSATASSSSSSSSPPPPPHAEEPPLPAPLLGTPVAQP